MSSVGDGQVAAMLADRPRGRGMGSRNLRRRNRSTPASRPARATPIGARSAQLRFGLHQLRAARNHRGGESFDVGGGGWGVSSETVSGSGARTPVRMRMAASASDSCKRACSRSSRRCAVCSRARMTSTSAARRRVLQRGHALEFFGCFQCLLGAASLCRGQAETEVGLAHAADQRAARDLRSCMRRDEQRAAAVTAARMPKSSEPSTPRRF